MIQLYGALICKSDQISLIVLDHDTNHTHAHTLSYYFYSIYPSWNMVLHNGSHCMKFSMYNNITTTIVVIITNTTGLNY